MYVDYYCIIILRGGNVTSQCPCDDPYFSLASLYNVKYSVMLWSDNRNILDYWISVARYCFKYNFDNVL